MADPKPWNEIAAGFPADLPAEAYDQARRKYFNEVVVPRLDHGSSPIAAWDHFKQGTERGSTMSTSGNVALPVAQFASGLTHALTKPLTSLVKSKTLQTVSDFSGKEETKLARTAAREGKGNIPTAVGEMVGSTVPLALAFETGGATLEAGGADVASTGYRLLRGGLAFGTFESAYANDGERITAGAKGFLTGMAFEGSLGLAGKLLRRGIPQKDVDKIVTGVLSGEKEATPEVEAEITKSTQSDVRNSRQEGRPQFVKEDPNTKGVSVLLHNQDGQAVTLKVRSGNEHAIVKQVMDITAAGGAVDGIIHHPNEVGLANRFMKVSADVGAQRYEGAKVIRTEPGQAPQIASEERINGKATTAVSGEEVVSQTTQRATPRGEEIKAGVRQLRDEDGYELSLGAQGQIGKDIQKLWRNDVPEATKELAANRLSAWELNDLIPEQWRREKPLPDDVTEPTHIGGEAYRDYIDYHQKDGGVTRAYREDFASDKEWLQASQAARAADRGVSEIELNRLQEIHEREPARTGGERFEDIGTTTGEAKAVYNILIPESEDGWLTQHRETGEITKIPFDEGANVGMTPRRFAIQVKQRTLARAFPGAGAITSSPDTLDPILRRLGVKTKVFEHDTTELPAVAYTGTPYRSYAYHEGLHVDKYHLPTQGEGIYQEGNQTVEDIAEGLRKFNVYKKLSPEAMREEAFVHAATAIRMGDAQSLAELVKMDGTVDEVFNMVYDHADRMLQASREGVDSAPIRVLQRKMGDLILRTTPEKSFELIDQTNNFLGDSWYDPAMGRWNLTSEGDQAYFENYKDLVDEVGNRSGAEWAPSSTLFAEARGVRGPIVPKGGSPTKEPPAMDTPPDTRWQGWTSISGWFRPMQPWVADLHTRVNDALSASGKELPIFPRWKDVDDAFRAGDNWLQNNYDSAAKLLDGVGKKQYDYFNVLATEPTHWPEMAKQLNLGPEDLTKIGQIDEWLGKFRDDTGILVKNYLRDEFPRLRGFGYNTEMVYGGGLNKTPAQMSTFERLISQGKLDPKSTHIGSFMNTMLREGFSTKFSDKPLKALEKLVDLKAKDGSYLLGNMRYPLVNYTRYMRGIPDVTGQIMNKTVTEFFGALGKRTTEMNKHLPSYAQLPTEFKYPQSYINKMLVWSYAASLGLRAAIPIRDAMQVFSTVLPVLGPAKFARGLARFAKEGFTFADEQGALLKTRNIGELHGDIFNELPPDASTDRITKFANKLLSPSRWGHNIGRTIGFYGEYDSALEGVRAFREGKASPEEFINDHTSLWWNDKPVRDRILGQIHDTGFTDEEVAKNIALEAIDLTLWPYRRGAQPTILRTGMGRVFGQFGMWPANYLDFLRRGATKFAENPANAMKTTAMWAASNYAAVGAMNSIGADAGKWFWFSPASIEMSPHAKFIEDLGQMWRESPDGREARKRVLEYPLNFFPSSLEAKNILKVLDSGEEPFDSNGHPTPALLKVLGFTPHKEEPERSLEQQVKFEAGFGEGRRRPQ